VHPHVHIDRALTDTLCVCVRVHVNGAAVVARYCRRWRFWQVTHRLLATMGTTGMVSMVSIHTHARTQTGPHIGPHRHTQAHTGPHIGTHRHTQAHRHTHIHTLTLTRISEGYTIVPDLN
jgi:hypothetical protein